MDIEGEEAQELLDRAIFFEGKLYARKNNTNYAFQETAEGIYHGYIVNDLHDNVLSAILQKHWD